MKTTLHLTAEGLPAEPLPASWAPLLSLFERVGVRVKAIAWGLVIDTFRAFRTGEGRVAMEGSPYAAFSYNDTLYVSHNASTEALAHELGHAVAWRKAGSPEGYNWSLNPDEGSEAEREACEVEVWVLSEYTDAPEAETLRRHYEIGIIIQYDPDDILDDEDDEDDYHEGEMAWEEYYEAIQSGRDLFESVASVNPSQAGPPVGAPHEQTLPS